MASPTSENESSGNRNFHPLYSNYVWNRLHGFYAFSSSNFIGTLYNLRKFAARFRPRKRWDCFPIALPSTSLGSYLVMSKPYRIHDVLEEIFEIVLRNLHSIEKNLLFWEYKEQGPHIERARFMIFERGPRAFIDETIHLFRGHSTARGDAIRRVGESASDYIYERVTVLSALRYSLATFLAQVYFEIDRIREELIKDPEQQFPSLLGTIDDLFTNLEASIGQLHATRQSNSSVDGSYSFPLLFEKLPEINHERSQWMYCDIRDAINSVYRNVHKLDSYISILVTKHGKPRKITRYWMRYSCRAVGLSICSIWLLQRSRLMGNDSTTSFYAEHVEQPPLSTGDEHFETFSKRHEGIMEQEKAQLTSNSLHRYEKELTHLNQRLLGGELAGELGLALLSEVPKLKLDVETAMLELNQMPQANEIKFAVRAALPAFSLSLLLFMLVRAWFKQDTKAEGRGRIPLLNSWRLVVEVEDRIMQCQNFAEQGMEKDAQCMFGLVLYSLNRLYHSVKGHAKASGKWLYLRRDIIDLASPNLPTTDKIEVTSRMETLVETLYGGTSFGRI